jgi:hypothetical protein
MTSSPGPIRIVRRRAESHASQQSSAGWLSVAALVVIVAFQILAAGARDTVRARVEHRHDRERLVRELTYRLGAGEFSLQTARALIAVSDVGAEVE